MTSDEAKQSITTWCTTDDDLSLVGEGSDPAAEFVLKITAGGLSASPVSLEALKGTGADRVTLRHTSTLSEGGDSATKMIQARPGWVTMSADRSAGTTVQTFIYLDGLTKHSFVQAAAELARTARLLESLGKGGEPEDRGVSVPASAALGGAAAASEAASPSYATSTPSSGAGEYGAGQYQGQSQYGGYPQYGQQQQGGQPLGAPSFSPSPQQGPTYAPAWAPTHTVPPQGARAWAAPDPAGPVVANLAPGLPIQVTEVRGAWARVVCSNGWTGWIDGRQIGVAA
jgi:Bacterial SH3 domain